MAFAATPVFLLMAFIAYLQYPPLCTAPGNLGFLSSMWFMYAIMSAVHSGPWLSLAWQPFKNATEDERRPPPVDRVTPQAGSSGKGRNVSKTTILLDLMPNVRAFDSIFNWSFPKHGHDPARDTTC